MQNSDQPARLTDRLPELGSPGFGSAVLRLAYMAAAQHRAQANPRGVKPWAELSRIDVSDQDTTGHGCPLEARSARTTGPVTTEGDR